MIKSVLIKSMERGFVLAGPIYFIFFINVMHFSCNLLRVVRRSSLYIIKLFFAGVFIDPIVLI